MYTQDALSFHTIGLFISPMLAAISTPREKDHPRSSFFGFFPIFFQFFSFLTLLLCVQNIFLSLLPSSVPFQQFAQRMTSHWAKSTKCVVDIHCVASIRSISFVQTKTNYKSLGSSYSAAQFTIGNIRSLNSFSCMCVRAGEQTAHSLFKSQTL